MRKIFALMFVFAVSAFSQKLPTRGQVELAGKRPYLRYTLPPGELRIASNSAIFDQPDYRTPDGEKLAKSLPEGTAVELGLVGAGIWNQQTKDYAIEVMLVPSSKFGYEMRDGVIYPRYLKDCGPNMMNRLALVEKPAPTHPTSQVVTQNLQPTPVPVVPVAPREVSQNRPPLVAPSPAPVPTSAPALAASPVPVAVSGIVCQQSPCEIRIVQEIKQTNTSEVKRDGFQKLESVGGFIMKSGIGTGSAAIGILLPGAIENSAYANRDGMIGAAKGRVPDVMNISASANPTSSSNSNPSQSQTGPTVTANGTGNGGNGGNGGQGGSGGSGGTGGSPSVVATATGGPAGSTGPIKIDINNDNKNNNSNTNGNTNNNKNDNKNNNDVDVNVDVDVNAGNHPPVINPPPPPPPPPPVKPPSNSGGKDHEHNNGNCNGPGNDTCTFK